MASLHRPVSLLTKLKRLFLCCLAICIVVVSVITTFLPRLVEARLNSVHLSEPPMISDDARILHASITVADWHAGSLLWNRDLLDHDAIGQLDIARLQTGGVALQVFTAVTRGPEDLLGLPQDTVSDQLTPLLMAQFWPPMTWNSAVERALYQSKKLDDVIGRSQGLVRLVNSRSQLQRLLWDRQQQPGLLGTLLAIGSSHALSNDLYSIDRLYDAGFRIFSLQHFFDRDIPNPIIDLSGDRLNDFGELVIWRLNAKQMIIDVSDSPVPIVREVLERSERPVIVSHTGIRSHCPDENNLPDELLKEITRAGGLIAIGFRAEAICDNTPAGIAEAIEAAVNLVGIDAVALGSGFDGATATYIDSSQMVFVTQALLNRGFNESDIGQLMGGNMVRFLAQQLPDE